MFRRIKLFKLSSILRCSSFLLVLILDKMWMDSIPDNGAFSGAFSEMDLFEWWEEALMYSAFIAIIFNGFISLALSFRPKLILKSILSNRYLLALFFWIELLTLPFLLVTIITKFQDDFLPPKETFIGQLFESFFPSDPGSRVYEKLIDINLALLWISMLLFVLCFYSVLRLRKNLIQQEDLPIGFDSQ